MLSALSHPFQGHSQDKIQAKTKGNILGRHNDVSASNFSWAGFSDGTLHFLDYN